MLYCYDPKDTLPQIWSDLRSSVKNFSALWQKLLEMGVIGYLQNNLGCPDSMSRHV